MAYWWSTKCFTFPPSGIPFSSGGRHGNRLANRTLPDRLDANADAGKRSNTWYSEGEQRTTRTGNAAGTVLGDEQPFSVIEMLGDGLWESEPEDDLEATAKTQGF
ncbi:hypothetical protein GCM10009304_17990 [Pseudomonas matsuisoli]|uniref:Uncharacterized protein n=1 Tax=Pseudomonas matsuisoli TaxID=1515666 RepID=A0A917PUX2_9PSED|nr:hypothetical protein GCM10009304_17990 [Pseudomonas matsuisoli]